MTDGDEGRAAEGTVPRRRWRRRFLLLAFVLVGLPVLLLMAALGSLRVESVRQAVLGRLSSYLAREYHLAVTVRDFQVEWGGRFELTDVQIGAPGAPPLVTTERVRGAVDLWTLRSPTLGIRYLEIQRPRVDLAAPIPEVPASEQQAAAPPGFEIRRLTVRDGAIAGPPVEKDLRQWLTAWRADGVEARGSFRGGVWDVNVEKGRATVERPGFAPLVAGLTGRISYKDGEPVRLADIRAVGDGLRLGGSGSVGLDPGAPTAATFEAAVEPRLLVAGVPPGGRLRARGEVRLPGNRGHAVLSADRVPAEVLRPYLDPKLYADLSLAGTTMDAWADVTAGPGDFTRAAGRAEAAWRRGTTRLARAEARVEPDGQKILLEIDGDLLPGSPGRRHVQGTLRAESWAKLAEASAEPVTAEVQSRDVAATLAEVRSLWPRLVPPLPAGTPARGSLQADLRLTGPLLSPDATLAADWSPEAGSRLTVRASGKPATRSGRAVAEAQRLPLSIASPFAPGLAGEVTGRAEISGTKGSYSAAAQLAATGAAYPPYLTRLDSARLDARGTLAGSPLAWNGKVNVDGAGLFAMSNVSGTARVESFTLLADGTLGTSPLLWNGTVKLTGQDVEAPGTARAARVGLDATGTFRPETLAWDGTLSLTGEEVEAPGTATAALVTLESSGRLRPSPFSWNGTLTLDGRDVAAPGTASAAHVRAEAAGDLSGLSLTRLAGTAHATIEAPRIDLPGSGTSVEGLRLEADADGRELRISSLSGSLPEGRTFTASGRASLSPLLAEADLDLSLIKPVNAVSSAALTASLRQGVLTVVAPAIDTATGPVRLDATVPLGSLRGVPALADAVAALPFSPAPGLISVKLDAPALDTAALLPALGMEAGTERARGALSASLTFDPAAPAAGRGEVRITGLTVETPQARATAEALTARLADGRLELPPTRLAVEAGGLSGAGVDLRGTAELDPDWSPWTDPPASVVRRVSADAGGTVEASLLQPVLQGGTGAGALTFSASASGPLDGLTGSLQASGPGASFFWPTPYATRVEAPELKVALRQGRWQIEEGRARLNGGTVSLDGGGSADGGFALGAGLTGVRYRLDYGLTVLVDGQLSLAMPPEGHSLLTGRITLERGILDRDVNLDRELVNALLAPDETPGTEASVLDQIDLDLRVTTVDGVRVKNNVGELRASWDTIRVTGTAENPVVRGRIDLDPGGLIYAYGQTVRIDRGSLLFRGDPLNDPEIDLATTSSLEDPDIAQLRGYSGSPLDLLTQRQERDERKGEVPAVRERIATGAQNYVTARLFSALGRSLGLSGIEVRPVLVFGEADPSARLTIGRELSPNVSFALSIDLRNTQRQTYVGELHGFRDLPGFTLQGFTNDEGNSGATLQQVLELGGGRTETRIGPRLRRVRVRAPKELSARRIRRTVRLERKAPVPEGAAFEAEVDVTDDLRRRGYPDPRVRAEVMPVAERPGWVDVNIDVEPGPPVRFEFAGDHPPRALRGSITGLYRTDFYEPASIDEMREETVKAFRGEGHLDPQVEITVERLRPDDPDGPRRVVVRSAAGRRVKLEDLRFAGIAPDAEATLRRQFIGTLARAELAAALPDADARLLGALRNLGYPEPRIEGRDVEENGDRLTVRLAADEAGERQGFGAIKIEGAPAAEASHLTAAQPLRRGDPARRDLAAEVSAILERDLRGHGYPDATVRPVLTVVRGGGNAVDLRFQVEPGEHFQVNEVAFDERGPSRRDYLAKVARIDPGAPLSAAEIDEARGRLFSTGLFSRVTADVARQEGGEARVTFSLTERPRYRLGYGLRWESGVGESAVVDAVDTNFLGRGITLGLRGLYEQDDQSGRLYLQTGGLLGTAFSLESFLLVRRLFDEGLVEDSAEAALQLARPFGLRTTGRLYARHRTTHLFEEEPLDPDFPIDFDIRRPYVGLQALFEGRDDAADPATGLFASVDLSGSGPFLGSDFNYARLFGQVQDYLGFGPAGLRLTWAQSLRIGVAAAFAGQELVEEERFKAGGEYSIRGYDTDTIGPREVLGSLVRFPGGEALLVVNEELRFPLPFNLSGLIFFDAGQVWADRADFGKDLAMSTGLGLRARTPLGLLRLDLGIPLDRRPGDPEYKLYFGFGNAF